MTRAVPNIFAPLTSPSLPNLDTNFLVGANSTVVPCTAAGTNAVVLTPFASTYTVSAYTDLELYSFDAPASSTGVMTVQVSSNAVLKLFRNGGSTQATTGDIISGGYCLIAYQASLDSAAGGFVIVYSSGGASSNPARSYLAGLTLSNNGTTKLDVAAGVATDSTNAVLMSSAAVITIDTATVGANGFDVGTIGVSTWYHVYLIAKTDGTTAGLVSLQATTPSPMPTGYTYKRRIGSFKSNGSSQITTFTQTGDKFEWKAPVLDVNAVTPTSAQQNTITISAPPGVVTEAILSAQASYVSGAATGLLVYPTSLTSPPAINAVIAVVASNANSSSNLRITTNGGSPAQICTKLTYGGSTTYSIESLGWIDRRGRDS